MSISAFIDPQLHQQMRGLAERNFRSLSDEIRRALTEHVQRENGDITRDSATEKV